MGQALVAERGVRWTFAYMEPEGNSIIPTQKHPQCSYKHTHLGQKLTRAEEEGRAPLWLKEEF